MENDVFLILICKKFGDRNLSFAEFDKIFFRMKKILEHGGILQYS